MLLIKQNHGVRPLLVDEALMASPGPRLRLHVQLQAGCLPLVLDRLQVAGQTPRSMEFQKENSAPAFVMLDFERVNEAAAKAFVPWLQQISGVLSVNMEWLSDNGRAIE